MNIKDMKTIIDGELIDTYGGDYTYRDIEYVFENGKHCFYEFHYGAKPEPMFLIEDEKEIEFLMTLI